MENSPEPILSVLDVVKESSWQTKANGGHAESAETGTTRKPSILPDRTALIENSGDSLDIKAFLIPMAADTSNLGYVGPVFAQGREKEGPFEYLPIKEDNPSHSDPTYEDLPAINHEYGKKLSCFVLQQDRAAHAHYDPMFTKNLYTYGEGSKAALKTKGRLKELKTNDLIFFWCSLAPYKPSAYKNRSTLNDYQSRFTNKYVVGFFTVRGIRHVTVGRNGKIRYKKLDNKETGNVSIMAIRKNQHFLDRARKPEFLVVEGNPDRSALLQNAIRLTERKIKTAGGKKRKGWTYKLNKLGQEVLKRPSYTRGIRTNIDEDGIKALISAIRKKNKEVADRLPDMQTRSTL